MTMERLEVVLRRFSTPRDHAVADGIRALKNLRGEDIPLEVFLSELVIARLGSVDLPVESGDRQYKYYKVANSLKERIEAGVYGYGKLLPSMVDLAREHDVATMTMQKALRLLQDAGYLRMKQGMGTTVSYLKKEED